MKVLLLNGSIHTDGNTRVALEEISKQLQKEGIETEIFQIGANRSGIVSAAINAPRMAASLMTMSATNSSKRQKKPMALSLARRFTMLIHPDGFCLCWIVLFIPAHLLSALSQLLLLR